MDSLKSYDISEGRTIMSNLKIPWPDWEIKRRIGNGSYGSVYEIERKDEFGHTETAALKVISMPKEEGEIDVLVANGYDNNSITEYYREGLKSIVDEYAMMASLKSHPNIVSCEDRKAVRQENGIGWDVYIRMELLKPFLKDLKDNEKTEKDVIKLGKDLLNALIACHEINIIHRDIKPENIFMTKYGGYKLGDFGVARIMSHTTNATKTGTPYYMAPEVSKDEKYGKEADIYSLGMVLYWLLNNRKLPFEPTDKLPSPSEKERAYKTRIAGKEIPDPLNGSPDLRLIVKKSLSYNPEARYRTAEEMLHELENLSRIHNDNKNVSSTKEADIPDCNETIMPPQAASTISDKKTDLGAFDGTIGNSWIQNSETIGPKPGGLAEAEQVSFTNIVTKKPDMIAPEYDEAEKKPKALQAKYQLKKDEEIILNDIELVDYYPSELDLLPGSKSIFSSVFHKKENKPLPSDIIAVSKQAYCRFCLRSNGTVVARGRNHNGECNVSHWRWITSIATGPNHTVGLRTTGTVVATGNNNNKQCEVSGWTDICAITAQNDHTFGLKKDGTVVETGTNYYGERNVSHWTDIVAISAGYTHIVGLKSDGTVVAAGANSDGQCNVHEWKDVIAITTGANHTVGLKADGTVVAAGRNDRGQCDVSRWKRIIAISANNIYTLGWRADGLLMIAGVIGQESINDWGTIAAISTSPCHQVVFKPNGRIAIKGISFSPKAIKKTVKEYEDIINWKKAEARKLDWLYIEINAGDLLKEVENGTDNLAVTCKAILNCMQQKDEFVVNPPETNKISKVLTVRYYCSDMNGISAMKGKSPIPNAGGKTIKEYEDIINWKKSEAHKLDWLYIEINAGDLLQEVEDSAGNLSTACRALMNCMLVGDQFIGGPAGKNKVSKTLTVRYYCDNLSLARNKYIDG